MKLVLDHINQYIMSSKKSNQTSVADSKSKGENKDSKAIVKNAKAPVPVEESSKGKSKSKVPVEEPVVVKENKKPNKKDIVVEDVKSDDDDDSEVEDSDSEDEQEQEDEDKQDQDQKVPKEKKSKISWDECVAEWEKNEADIKENLLDKKKLEEALHVNNKQRNELERKSARIFVQMSKSHVDEVNKAAKEKPKRKGNKDGGFNKLVPVPPKLIKYLGLEEGILMSRPKVMSALNDKFKDSGLKEGQKTILDKETAKALGKEKGRVIEFTGFQSFLKEFYEEAFPEGNTNNVEL